ncbi:MAG: class II histone deacetylase, partial [Granulosicoccus sp.]
SRMMCSAETFRTMTEMLMSLDDGRLVAAHEGGYSEVYVPFCGHAMLEQMSGSQVTVPDPLGARIHSQQPNQRACQFQSELISDMVNYFL